MWPMSVPAAGITPCGWRGGGGRKGTAFAGAACPPIFAPGQPPHPRLAPGSLDLALLVHMYHEVTQPYGLLWNLRPALRPGAKVAVIDARKETGSHGTPPDLLRCELAAVGYRETAFYDLQENTYLAVFVPPNPGQDPTSPGAIRPCRPSRGRW